MMEWMRKYVMKRAYSKREGLSKYDGKLMPVVLKQLEAATDEANNCFETPADVNEFEVEHKGETYVVMLDENHVGTINGI